MPQGQPEQPADLSFEFITSITSVTASEWNGITGTDYPFTRYEFLQALESSGATRRESGWQPHHLLIRHCEKQQPTRLIGVMPLYLKWHSYGEYVFDFAWAEAYQRYGLDYYPKLVSAIPFTPATGPRLCLSPGFDRNRINRQVFEALKQQAETLNVSSWHLLFPTEADSHLWQAAGAPQRLGVQFHWFNNQFQSFEAYLGTFSSRKRKNLKKERQQVQDQNIRMHCFTGADITEAMWQQFYRFYQLTYAKRSGHGGYLNSDFFETIGTTLREHIVMVLAEHQGKYIAGALCFRDSTTLYGRYWGCIAEANFLHFEACYYQGIDFCIATGLQRFDPGAQGEHKIQRGFTPIYTYSNHWLVNPEFQTAVKQFLSEEQHHIQHYKSDAEALLPFKCTD